MEERRIDPLQIIGMILIFGIFTWMMYNQSVSEVTQQSTTPNQETTTAEKAVNPLN